MDNKIIEMLNDPQKFGEVLDKLTYKEKLCLAFGLSAFRLASMKVLSSDDDCKSK